MRVRAAERGIRPSLSTKGRVIAPEAAKYLAEQLQDKTFADSVLIVVDWEGDFNWNGEGAMPEELKLPAMVLIVEKLLPQYSEKNRMKVEYAMELEEMFGRDNATKDDLDQIVYTLEEHVRQEEEKRKNWHDT